MRKLIHRSLFTSVLVIVFATYGLTQIYTYTNNSAGNYQTINSNLTTGAPSLYVVNGAVNFPAGCASGYTTYGYPGTNTWNAAGPAVEFQLTTNPGYVLGVTSIAFQSGKNSVSTGPANARVAYSTNGGVSWTVSATNYGTTTNTSCAIGFTTTTWTLPTAISGFYGTLLIRFQPNSAGSATSSGLHYLRQITVNGTVTASAIPGCTNPAACNYNPAATVDNGTCTYPGCNDVTACNYNPSAGCFSAGSCLFPGDPCDDGNALTSNDTYQPNCVCAGVVISAFSPFMGFAIREQTIAEPAAQTFIDAQLTDPAPARCWRVYACFSALNWELQAYAGGSVEFPLWYLNSSTGKFYQDPYGGVKATDISTALYPFFPHVKYDSWFTIRATDSDPPTPNLLVAEGSFPGNRLFQWESTGDNFLAVGPIGSAITIVVPGLYPSTYAMPDANSEVLVGQFTSDGTISGNFNFQFRQMTVTGDVFLPITLAYSLNAAFVTPAASNVDICALLLPIELVEFNAKPEGHMVALDWITYSELNNEVFVVERSRNTIEWEEVGRLPGAGTSNNVNSYQAFDTKPLQGVSYYRLKQIDIDGEFSVSPIRSVEFNGTPDLSLYPNPNSGKWITIKGDTYTTNRIVIRGVDGRVVWDRSYLTEEARFIDLSSMDLAKGVYSVEFHSNLMKEPLIEKLVIQ